MDKKKTWMWVGGGIVVLALILIFVGGSSPSYPPPSGPSSGSTPVYAPQGELVAGFPTELILDTSAKTTQSYSINYSSSTDQYTANFSSGQSMLALYGAYKTYLTQNGWTITNDMHSYTSSRGLYATKGNADASAAIVDQGATRQVTVTYLNHGTR